MRTRMGDIFSPWRGLGHAVLVIPPNRLSGIRPKMGQDAGCCSHEGGRLCYGNDCNVQWISPTTGTGDPECVQDPNGRWVPPACSSGSLQPAAPPPTEPEVEPPVEVVPPEPETPPVETPPEPEPPALPVRQLIKCFDRRPQTLELEPSGMTMQFDPETCEYDASYVTQPGEDFPECIFDEQGMQHHPSCYTPPAPETPAELPPETPAEEPAQEVVPEPIPVEEPAPEPVEGPIPTEPIPTETEPIAPPAPVPTTEQKPSSGCPTGPLQVEPWTQRCILSRLNLAANP